MPILVQNHNSSFIWKNLIQYLTQFEIYFQTIQLSLGKIIRNVMGLWLLLALLYVSFIGIKSWRDFSFFLQSVSQNYEELKIQDGKLISKPENTNFHYQSGSDWELYVVMDEKNISILPRAMIILKLYRDYLEMKLPYEDKTWAYPENLNIALNESLLGQYKKSFIMAVMPMIFIFYILFDGINRLFEIVLVGIFFKIRRDLIQKQMPVSIVWKVVFLTFIPVAGFSFIVNCLQLGLMGPVKWLYYLLHCGMTFGALKYIETNHCESDLGNNKE